MQFSSDANLAERDAHADEGPSPNANPPHAGGGEDHLKILVIDDEPAIREVLAAYLHERGHEVATAANGSEGLEMFAQGEWDLILTDGLMPEMSGTEFATKIKNQNPTIPIFLVSGSSDMVQAAGEALSPIDRIIRKPFTRETLAAALESVVPAHRAA
ncbi:MAG TPA: response regulator [Chthoniobacteraceae bacterium]|nr:response regulator [Chthoniobacteraceae bacterium]